MQTVTMTAYVYEFLKATVGTLLPETGAVLGANDGCISKVWFDELAGSGQKYYQPSSQKVEEVVRGWMQDGYHFSGIVHSHTAEYPMLSPMDMRSAVLIMRVNHMVSILMGVFCNGELLIYRVSGGLDGTRPYTEQVEYRIV